MVSTRLLPIEIGIIRNETTKLFSGAGIHSIKDIPVLIGFLLGGIFIVLHWLIQQVFFLPKKLVEVFVK